MHFISPKNHFSKDFCLSADTPIFATSKSRLEFTKSGKIDVIENDMMDAWWKDFEFTHEIPKEK